MVAGCSGESPLCFVLHPSGSNQWYMSPPSKLASIKSGKRSGGLDDSTVSVWACIQQTGILSASQSGSVSLGFLSLIIFINGLWSCLCIQRTIGIRVAGSLRDGVHVDWKKKRKAAVESQDETIEYRCLVRATDGKKNISTLLSAKDHQRFQMAYATVLKAHMDALKKREKKDKKEKKATTAGATAAVKPVT